MVQKDNLKVIDYQDLMLGTSYYDLVSLLEDSYFPLKESIKMELMNYFKKVTNNTLSDSEFKKVYDFNAIQRIYKALGSFTYIYNIRDDDRYLKYVGVGVSRLINLLKEYRELSPSWKFC